MKITFITVLVSFALVLSGCSKDEVTQPEITDFFEVNGCTSPLSDNYDPNATKNNGSCQPTDCSKCDFFASISNEGFGFDGEELGVKPGDIICLDGAITYERPILFTNIRGTADNPVLITNCNGQALVNLPGRSYAIGTNYSEHFRITGTGDPDFEYGIRLTGTNGRGLDLNNLSTNFEVDHLEISDIGFAGIMAKTDPSCDDETIRGNFTMRDVSFHHNFVHDVGGEGFYIGNSFYENGRDLSCGNRLPHDIINVKVYSNIFKNTGWEGLQVGCAIQGAEIYNNDIENFGQADRENQRNGLQLGEGTGGLCYNNRIVNGNGNGMNVLGYGDNLIFNNIIVNAKRNGIFCDTRFSPGDGFMFINNTVINPGLDGLKIFAFDLNNKAYNNTIVNPGNYDVYENDNSDSKPEDAYISYGDKTELSNNYFTRDITELHFLGDSNLDLKADSPLIDQGLDVSSYNITFDFEGRLRPAGDAYDIGAFEFQQ
jgi:hypothetical protein